MAQEPKTQEPNSIEYEAYRQTVSPQPKMEQLDNRSPAIETSKSAEKTQEPILDLAYKTPPESLTARYLVTRTGEYLSAQNGTTVLFQDNGKKLSTAKTDAQTINDMLEVAKAKGWDSIKISGSHEFKAMMYVAAESQGIRTSGYKPTPADEALLEKMRQDKALNKIEESSRPQPDRSSPSPKQTAQPEATEPASKENPKHESAARSNEPPRYTTDPVLMSEADQLESRVHETVKHSTPGTQSTAEAIAHQAADSLRGAAIKETNTKEPETIKSKTIGDGDLALKPEFTPYKETAAGTDKALTAEAVQARYQAEEQARAERTKEHQWLKNEYEQNKARCEASAAQLGPEQNAKFRFYETLANQMCQGMDDKLRHEALAHFYQSADRAMNGKDFAWENPNPMPEIKQSEQLKTPERTQSNNDYDIDR